MSARHARRLLGRDVPCRACAIVDNAVRERADEDDAWWWLERFGVRRNGLTASQHVACHGLPEELREIVEGLRHR